MKTYLRLMIAGLLFAIPSSGKEIVLNRITKVFPYALPGKTVIIEKVFDDQTKNMRIRSDYPGIADAAGLVNMENAERNAKWHKLGSLENQLSARLHEIPDYEKRWYEISVKQKAGIIHPMRGQHSEDVLKTHSQTISRLKPEKSIKTVLAENGIQAPTQLNENFRHAQLNKSELLKLAKDPNVTNIREKVDPTPAFYFPLWLGSTFSLVDIVSQARSAYSHSQNPIPSTFGSGVNVATFESGLKSSWISCSGLSPTAYDAHSAPYSNGCSGSTFYAPGDSLHSLVTFRVLANSAPGANLYHRCSWDYSDANSQDYLIDNGIKSVSKSVTGNGSILGDQELVMDDFAYRYPYPHFVNPTGNLGWQSVPTWQNYNQILVGNVYDSVLTHFVVDTCHPATQTKNPPPIYGSCIEGSGSNCSGDRELPYLVAPGWSPQLITTTPCAWANQEKGSIPCVQDPNDTTKPFEQMPGTSQSAPLVNGLVAGLIEASWIVGAYPELGRALLLQTAQNVRGPEWNQNIDGRDGNGIVHGSNAVSFITNTSFADTGNTASTTGYYYGTWQQSDFPSTTRTWNILIPNPKPSGKHLRVVLTWDSFPDLVSSPQTNLLPDLDLWMNHNGGYASSTSYDSNIEILDVPSSQLTAGSTYSMAVYPFSWRRGANSRSTFTYGALTWGFVEDHAR